MTLEKMQGLANLEVYYKYLLIKTADASTTIVTVRRFRWSHNFAGVAIPLTSRIMELASLKKFSLYL